MLLCFWQIIKIIRFVGEKWLKESHKMTRMYIIPLHFSANLLRHFFVFAFILLQPLEDEFSVCFAFHIQLMMMKK